MKSEHKSCVGGEGPPYKGKRWECGLLGPVVAGGGRVAHGQREEVGRFR